MIALARDWAQDRVMVENARLIVNVLLQTDTTKKFFSLLASNYLRIKCNDTAILHDL